MSAARRRRSGGNRPAVLAGLSLLAIPGFALGVLGGVLWEDPGLVASYVLGRTEAVAWRADRDDGSPAGELPAVAAPPEVVTPARPEPRPSRAPARAAEGRFAVQVGAFAQKGAADRLAGSLREKGFPVYLAAGEASGAARWRVRVGPLGTRAEGERAAARLKSEERLPTWVLEEDR